MEISTSVSVMGSIGSIGEERMVCGIKTVCCTGDAGGFCRQKQVPLCNRAIARLHSGTCYIVET